MQSIYKRKFEYYYFLLKDAFEANKLVKIYENYYEISNMRLELSGCNCCNRKYIDIFIDGIVYKPRKLSLSSSNDSSNDCVAGVNFRVYTEIKDVVVCSHTTTKYKRYKFWGPLSAYNIMCKQFDVLDDEYKDFEFKCQYGNDMFDHKILSEKEICITDAKFRKGTETTYTIV